MYNLSRLEKFKAFFRVLFCRHKVTKPFKVMGGSDEDNMKVLYSGVECQRCGGKKLDKSKENVK